MAVREILLLGNPRLYQASPPVDRQACRGLRDVVEDLHDTMMAFRRKYGAGRAIAAPQIGVMQRLIYVHIQKPLVIVNPQMTFIGSEGMEVWDDCMCFPELLVKVRRHRRCRMFYRDLDWCEQEMSLEDDLSELLQHEYDHLDGVLAVSRALDDRSLALRSQRTLLD
jgi:peptide deformylase